jgi:hypothetical protein
VKRWLIVLAACGSPPVAAPAHHVPSTTSRVDRGLDFERGRGVRRDFTKAVEIYRASCHEGCGDLASCQRLFRLGGNDRGVVMSGREMLTLAGRLCDRKDENACIAAVLFGLRDETAIPQFEKGKDVEACDAGYLAACQLVMFGASFNFGGSSGVEEREQTAATKACLLGDRDGCDTVTKHWTYECEGKDLGACLDAKLVDWTSDLGSDSSTRRDLENELAQIRGVTGRTITACTDGDVDACKALDKDLPPAELCDAGDFAACSKLAEQGDAHAKQRACAAGADAGCDLKVPRQPDVRALAGFLRLAREECEKQHNQSMCDELAKQTAIPRCP